MNPTVPHCCKGTSLLLFFAYDGLLLQPRSITNPARFPWLPLEETTVKAHLQTSKADFYFAASNLKSTAGSPPPQEEGNQLSI